MILYSTRNKHKDAKPYILDSKTIFDNYNNEQFNTRRKLKYTKAKM